MFTLQGTMFTWSVSTATNKHIPIILHVSITEFLYDRSSCLFNCSCQTSTKKHFRIGTINNSINFFFCNVILYNLNCNLAINDNLKCFFIGFIFILSWSYSIIKFKWNRNQNIVCWSTITVFLWIFFLSQSFKHIWNFIHNTILFRPINKCYLASIILFIFLINKEITFLVILCFNLFILNLFHWRFHFLFLTICFTINFLNHQMFAWFIKIVELVDHVVYVIFLILNIHYLIWSI